MECCLVFMWRQLRALLRSSAPSYSFFALRRVSASKSCSFCPLHFTLCISLYCKKRREMQSIAAKCRILRFLRIKEYAPGERGKTNGRKTRYHPPLWAARLHAMDLLPSVLPENHETRVGRTIPSARTATACVCVLSRHTHAAIPKRRDQGTIPSIFLFGTV